MMLITDMHSNDAYYQNSKHRFIGKRIRVTRIKEICDPDLKGWFNVEGFVEGEELRNCFYAIKLEDEFTWLLKQVIEENE